MLSRLKQVKLVGSLCVGLGVMFNLAQGQQGDLKDPEGTVQLEVWKNFEVPPAPVLTPAEALESFSLPEGFRIELVASEPLVGVPVEIEFDPEGRLWAVEMRGYMPNVEGTNETDPVGRIVVLEDVDGDGRMDKNTVFLDNLVMPRALAVLNDGVLVAEPPKLWLCKDNDGDLKCDERILMDDDYAPQNDPKLGMKSNPEHASNGLLWGMDNWIYSANHTSRFRYLGGKWEKESTVFRGQWGISQDNYGRFFYNSNSDHFRGDYIASHYLARNSNFVSLAGSNVRVNPDQTVWPGRITTGVNRGYKRGVLRENGTLSRFTGACGTLIYRGSNFPDEFLGDGFVCEPTGNFVRRNKVWEKDGIVSATNAYHESEFLTSTDERFRPVNLVNGPDGCLYVVDMYRGLIQHRLYLTTFLRRQIEERGLFNPLDHGRIYRVVYEGKPTGKSPKLSQLSSAELVEELGHEDAWRRDTAQRLIVERQDTSVVAALSSLAVNGQHPLGQIHALWALHGLNRVSENVVEQAVVSADPKVRAAALRVSEALIGKLGPGRVLKIWEAALNDVPEVQLQLALSLGEIQGEGALDHLKTIAGRNLHHPYIVSSVLSSLYDRELEFVESALESDGVWAQNGAGSILGDLAGAVFRARHTDRILGMLKMAESHAGSVWKTVALIDGANAAAFKKVRGELRLTGDPIQVDEAPRPLVALASHPSVGASAIQLMDAFIWPGKDVEEKEEVVALTADEQALFDAGRDLFLISCGACHQPHGRGQDGLAPPLVDSDWVLGSPERITRIVLHGLQGPIEIEGKKWELVMPGLGVFDDQQLASVLTYVRREWGHTASAVSPEFVGAIRAKYPDRIDMWTVAELGE